MSENKLRYPVVFVHGMFGWGDDEGINNYLPYWGATTGNLITYLNELGYETYSASVGPASSAWDRACELYARLTGGIVDYGKSHSEKAHHRRFGRFYEKPLLEKWDEENKIYLIGHSFGGNTIRLFMHILAYGAPEEVEAITEDDKPVSPFFKGGNENLVASLVTICAPHNGTSTFNVAKKFGIMPLMKGFAYNYIGIAGRSPAEGTIFDFHLEQYGVSDTPGQKDAFPLRRAKKQFKNNSDNIEYDMGTDGAKELNDKIEICPNVYYFSYSYNCVSLAKSGKFHYPNKCDFPFLTLTSYLDLIYKKIFWHVQKGDLLGHEFDGLVDLPSARHPDDEPYKSFDENDIKPGIWNVMKTRDGDHGTPIGLFADKETTHDFYLEIMDLFKKIEE